ncbi:YggT family protein [Novosphingobium pituita]|uniref:YggT family protein n=1 Tax=Novosphingobium pituita TaxID=3056842 RepID=A0ABQ6P858_9SPHN|nr:YggT family protein [Novosphingobium sp. IK01]MDK4807025.1 YggT family protein [Novosphingobium aromaticivorans]GMM61435.1 YggT family protein [Novosphingobium sp. IK01]
MLYALIVIIGRLMDIFQMVIIIQIVLGLLISFNVVNLHNDFVAAIWRALNVIIEPFLRPIRRFMPDTRPFDLSPMVLLFGLWAAQMLLIGLGQSMGALV